MSPSRTPVSLIKKCGRCGGHLEVVCCIRCSVISNDEVRNQKFTNDVDRAGTSGKLPAEFCSSVAGGALLNRPECDWKTKARFNQPEYALKRKPFSINQKINGQMEPNSLLCCCLCRASGLAQPRANSFRWCACCGGRKWCCGGETSRLPHHHQKELMFCSVCQVVVLWASTK